MEDAGQRLLDSSVEAGGAVSMSLSNGIVPPSASTAGPPPPSGNPLLAEYSRGADARLASLAETVGFTVNDSGPGLPPLSPGAQSSDEVEIAALLRHADVDLRLG